MSDPVDKHCETLAIEHRDGVDWLTLDRPAQYNAVNPAMAAELSRYFSGLLAQPAVRAVVIRGNGKHFCAGFDLDHLPARDAGLEAIERHQRAMSDIVLRMRRCPQPIIALMHGAACGAGLAIALAADIRYAAEGARMNVAMARIGLTGCDMGISHFLPRAVGPSNAAQMMMGGRFVFADQAFRIGLVSAIAPVDELGALADQMLLEMLAMSPAGLRLTKEGMNAAAELGSLEAIIGLEDKLQVMCTAPYMHEGVAAFRERRPPRYAAG